jgi:hypothetical protein
VAAAAINAATERTRTSSRMDMIVSPSVERKSPLSLLGW